MDHSGLDRELINSPSACWVSRQGELSASSVSGRARGDSNWGPAGSELVYVARFGLRHRRFCRSVHTFTAAQRKNPLPRPTRDKLPIRKWWQITVTTELWVVSYQVEGIDRRRDRWFVWLCCAVYSWLFGTGPAPEHRKPFISGQMCNDLHWTIAWYILYFSFLPTYSIKKTYEYKMTQENQRQKQLFIPEDTEKTRRLHVECNWCERKKKSTCHKQVEIWRHTQKEQIQRVVKNTHLWHWCF